MVAGIVFTGLHSLEVSTNGTKINTIHYMGILYSRPTESTNDHTVYRSRRFPSCLRPVVCCCEEATVVLHILA
jgi:hypothetical protein